MLIANQFRGYWFGLGKGGDGTVQTAHPRDVGALALVVGVFLILFVVSLMLGSPPR